MTIERQGPLSDEPVAFDDIPFRGIVEQSLAGVYIVLDECFIYANETFAGMFGYRPEEFTGMAIVDLVTADSLAEVQQKVRMRISGEIQTIHYFPRCRHRDGHVVHLEVHGSRVEYRGQPTLSGLAIDITERVHREEELRRSREQLRELAAHLNSVREEQRALLAREVHDVLGGMLTSIKMDVARIVRRAAAPDLVEIHEIATDLISLVQETIDTARKISDELRPSVLDTLGLVAAIRALLDQFGTRSGVKPILVSGIGEPTFSAIRATQCYRILQEALTNVARHAQATMVEVRLTIRDGFFVMEVADDGRGIDPAAMRIGSIGLLSMAERARKIGGSLDVRGAGGAGTVVILTVPLADPERTGND